MPRSKTLFRENKSRFQWEGKFHDLHPVPGKFFLRRLCGTDEMRLWTSGSMDPMKKKYEILSSLYRKQEKKIMLEIESNVGVSSSFLSDALEAYLKDRATAGVLSLTIMSYRTTLLEMLNFLGERSVDDISADEIESIIDNLRRKSLSPTTIKKRVVHIKSFFDWAASRYGFDGPKFPRLKTPIKEPDPYSHNEVLMIISRLEEMGHKNGLRLVMMQAMTGMRVGEVLGLKIHSIKDQIISNAKGQVHGLRRALPKQLKHFLSHDLEGRSQEEIWYLDDGSGSQFWKSSSSASHFMRSLTSSLGIRIRQPNHAFRSFLATELLTENISLGLVQDIMGHKSPGTTMRYVKSSRIKKAGNDALDRLFRRQIGGGL